MTREHDWSAVFWSVMLPVCWVLAPALTLLAHAQLRAMENGSDTKLFQTTLFLAVFLAVFGLVAVRILIARAIDEHHIHQARLLGAISAALSLMLIVYGLATFAD